VGDLSDEKGQWTYVGKKKKNKKKPSFHMRGTLWNIRGLNNPGRNLGLGNLIRLYRLDFVGIQETKKESFHPNFFKEPHHPNCF
jgi:hypothetical protein